MTMFNRQADLLRKLGLTHFLPETSSTKTIPCKVEGCKKMFRAVDHRDKHVNDAHKDLKRALYEPEERPKSETKRPRLDHVAESSKPVPSSEPVPSAPLEEKKVEEKKDEV